MKTPTPLHYNEVKIQKRRGQHVKSSNASQYSNSLPAFESKEDIKQTAKEAIAAALSERKATFPSKFGKDRDGRGSGIILKGSGFASKPRGKSGHGKKHGKYSKYKIKSHENQKK